MKTIDKSEQSLAVLDNLNAFSDCVRAYIEGSHDYVDDYSRRAERDYLWCHVKHLTDSFIVFCNIIHGELYD
jgi:hypothetical protein